MQRVCQNTDTPCSDHSQLLSGKFSMYVQSKCRRQPCSESWRCLPYITSQHPGSHVQIATDDNLCLHASPCVMILGLAALVPLSYVHKQVATVPMDLLEGAKHACNTPRPQTAQTYHTELLTNPDPKQARGVSLPHAWQWLDATPPHIACTQ